MQKYNIIQTDLPNIVLASCNSLKLAKQYLKDMKKTDEYLQKYYNWKKLPKYKIIEVTE